MASEGPLKVWLKRYDDREARVWVQRWKADHPVTISLSLTEFQKLCAAEAIVSEQVAAAPRAATTAGSMLDLGELVEISGAPA